MADQRDAVAGEADLGGTMRLGAYPATLEPGSIVAEAYQSTNISERHRHRYEVNNEYRDRIAESGLRFSGTSPDGHLVEFVEYPRRGPPVRGGHPGSSGAQEQADPPASAVRRVHRRGDRVQGRPSDCRWRSPSSTPTAGNIRRTTPHSRCRDTSRNRWLVADHDFDTVSSETVYRGSILALRADQVRMPGGSTATREVVEHFGAVAVAAVDESRRVAMVYQYRHPLGRRLWELPAGLLDEPGEDPAIAAARELREETGVVAEHWSVLVDVASSPGFTDEAVRVYLASGLSHVERPEAEHEEADLTVHWVDLEQAAEQVMAGEIVNAVAALGVLAAHAAVVERIPTRSVDAPWRDRPSAVRQARPVMTTFRPALDDQLQGYLDHLTIERGVAANTISSYRRDLRRYAEHLNSRGIDDLRNVTETDVSDFLVALRSGDPENGVVPLSAVSAARALIAVRGLHRFAAAEGVIDVDVARAVKPPTPSRRLPKSLTLDEVLALLDGAGGDAPSDGPLTLRNRALLELLYSTGARISEAVGLDVDDIDTHARSVLLRGKGGKQRLVPGRAPGHRGAGRLPGARSSRPGSPRTGSTGRAPAIFLNARGGRLSRQSAWQVLQDAAERAGITSGVSPHTLRHSFATHLLDGGADVRVVQELLGHASVTTTQIYTLVTVHALREVWAGAHPQGMMSPVWLSRPRHMDTLARMLTPPIRLIRGARA